jgi:hypothetical protein
MAIPTRTADRLSSGLKKYQPILASAKSRDVNESDTSMIVTDILAEVFGYDKYSEITRELCIRGTYCDLATRIDGKFQLLIEVKAIGLELKAPQVKQAVDYAANQGIEWVALTNGSVWKVYRVIFAKPIDAEPVLDIDLLALNSKNSIRRTPRTLKACSCSPERAWSSQGYTLITIKPKPRTSSTWRRLSSPTRSWKPFAANCAACRM